MNNLSDSLRLENLDRYKHFDGHGFFKDKILKFREIRSLSPLRFTATVVHDGTEYKKDVNNLGSVIYVELDTDDPNNLPSIDHLLQDTNNYVELGLDVIDAYHFYGKMYVTTNRVKFINASDPSQSYLHEGISLNDVQQNEKDVRHLKNTSMGGSHEFITYDFTRFIEEETFEVATIYPHTQSLRIMMRITSDNANHGQLFIVDVDGLTQKDIPVSVITEPMSFQSFGEITEINEVNGRLYVHTESIELRDGQHQSIIVNGVSEPSDETTQQVVVDDVDDEETSTIEVNTDNENEPLHDEIFVQNEPITE